MTMQPTGSSQSAINEIIRFCKGSPAGLLQVLVASSAPSTFARIIKCPTYPVAAKSSGLAATIRQFKNVMADPDMHAPTFLARLYASVRLVNPRKRTGQFFTSQTVASWALSLEQPTAEDDVCDAGAGTGVFAYTILLGNTQPRSYIGIENDPILALCAAHVLDSLKAPSSYKVWYANFLLLDKTTFAEHGLRTPTFVISNPPFIRYHNLSGRSRIRSALKSSLGLTLSSLSGSAGYFISRSADLVGQTSLLASPNHQNRRLLFFLPTEAAGAAHLQRLEHDLRRMHGWTSEHHKIPHLQTGVDRHPSNSVALLFVFKQHEVQSEAPLHQSISTSRVLDILSIRRGISTGCNDFFVLTDAKARELNIPSNYLQKVLPTRLRLRESVFSESSWHSLLTCGEPCWLLVLPNRDIADFEKPVQDYLKKGLRRGLHATPTAKKLRSWFSIPTPTTAPDVFISYFFRSAPRFVLNEAGVYHLTNILGGRFVSPIASCNRRLLIDALNNEAEQWIKNKMAIREYKRGLRKIEPRELSLLPIDPAILELTDHKRRGKNGSLF